jgi:hypothetical protein
MVSGALVAGPSVAIMRVCRIDCSQLTIAAGVPQTTEGPRRVLVVGASDDARVMAAARALPSGGMLICIERDRAAGARAAGAFASEGLPAHVMIGEPHLFVRKVSGPFDLILTAGAIDAPLAAQLERKLASEGLIRTL